MTERFRYAGDRLVCVRPSEPLFEAEVGPFQSCKCSIEEEIKALLLATLAQVGLYTHSRRKGEAGSPFATKRPTAGANAVRNMVVWAWLDSANTPVGYPMADVGAVRSGLGTARGRKPGRPGHARAGKPS
jgi:hypothetical protein